MQCRVDHRTIYQYSRPVRLATHVVRLAPRLAPWQRLIDFQLNVIPLPWQRRDFQDGEGNHAIALEFPQYEADSLAISSTLLLETWPLNFDPFAVGRGLSLGSVYSDHDWQTLQAWLAPPQPDPRVLDLADRLAAQAGGDLAAYLNGINGWLKRSIEHEVRAAGAPMCPGETLASGRGACRDVAILFVALCRCKAVAARFVSGYQTSETLRTQRYMHAWPEAFVPGFGWHGFDPTHGTPIGAGHIALAAAAAAEGATPIEGGFFGAADSTMTIDLTIEAWS
jgi:transglutaminase-like putative cysteine protease